MGGFNNTKEFKKQRLQQAKDYAISRGGECLSTEYINASIHLEWHCKVHDYKWPGTFNSVLSNGRNSNAWCKHCAQDKHRNKYKGDYEKERLQIAHKVARDRNGWCLSTNYENNSSILKWRCELNHEWPASFRNVVHAKSWCPTCNKENKDGSNYAGRKPNNNWEELCKKYATKHNGKFLSIYTKNNTFGTFRCENNHKWTSRLDGLFSSNRWCTICSSKNKTENRVRLFFETYFGESFPNKREKWNTNFHMDSPFLLKSEIIMLKHNPRKKKTCYLELDGYCSKLNIAFEFDGIQHYEPSTRVKAVEERLKKFSNLCINDYKKDINCLNNGVRLIRIPDMDNNKQYEFFGLLRHVIHWCKKQNLHLNFTLSQLRYMRDKF